MIGTVNPFKLMAQVAAVTGLLLLPASLVVAPGAATAQGVSISTEFRTALEPYGAFQRSARWGEVWVPERISRDWRPYTVGHWLYSDDYGWYWDSGPDEAAWGWVAFHYGRWVWDAGLGWSWVPGREWGPAWVEWRRGGSHLGWAPLPPDDIVVDVRDNPRYWVFVRPNDFLSTRIASVVVEPEPAILDESVVVNETVLVGERNFAVNPGIAPAFVAAEIGRPVPAFRVQPRVLAGTANIQGAIQVRAQDLNRADVRRSIVQESNVRQTNNMIQPATSVPRPEPLGPNERGKLGQNPPRAAGLTGQSPQEPGALQSQEGANRSGARGTLGPGRGPQPGTVGRGPERGPEPGLRERGPQPGTVGRGPERGPEQGLHERGPQPGTVGRAPERGPEQGLRERGPQPGTVGRAPERER